MSLVPSLSCGRTRRDQLNSFRNTFSFVAILIVYGTAVIKILITPYKLILFQVVEKAELEFRYLSYICAGLGSAASFFFLF
jgi:hypothetical protein